VAAPSSISSCSCSVSILALSGSRRLNCTVPLAWSQTSLLRRVNILDVAARDPRALQGGAQVQLRIRRSKSWLSFRGNCQRLGFTRAPLLSSFGSLSPQPPRLNEKRAAGGAFFFELLLDCR
jgi:hypothetical protein